MKFQTSSRIDSLGAGCLPAMRTHPSRLESSHFSGFYGSLECLKSISDIQCQTGKPITIATASVAIKESAKVSFLILSAWTLGPPRTCKNSASAQGVEWAQSEGNGSHLIVRHNA
jgi:hypothetical protein